MKKYNDMKRKVFIAVMSLVVSGGLSGFVVLQGGFLHYFMPASIPEN